MLARTIKISRNLFAVALAFFLSFAAICAHAATEPTRAQRKVIADTVRLLAIGNSFSEDAVEHYLYGLAKAAGIPVIIGNLYIGGAPLSLHWQNASADKPAYGYRKTGADGHKKTVNDVTIAKALLDEKWDFISFQQASPLSGKFDTYREPLPLLFKYVQEKVGRKDVKYVFHQTWAYAQDSKHGGFVSYNNNQMEMYRAIMDASSRVKELVPIDILVPAGTAIQNGRTSFIGDNFCRDGYHLDLKIGRYTASAAWFEALFGKSVIGNSFKPDSVSDEEAALAQHAAHAAVRKPFKITELKRFKQRRQP